jgi:hypothetical protein
MGRGPSYNDNGQPTAGWEILEPSWNFISVLDFVLVSSKNLGPLQHMENLLESDITSID